jgi:hypothetical protein
VSLQLDRELTASPSTWRAIALDKVYALTGYIDDIRYRGFPEVQSRRETEGSTSGVYRGQNDDQVTPSKLDTIRGKWFQVPVCEGFSNDPSYGYYTRDSYGYSEGVTEESLPVTPVADSSDYSSGFHYRSDYKSLLIGSSSCSLLVGTSDSYLWSLLRYPSRQLEVSMRSLLKGINWGYAIALVYLLVIGSVVVVGIINAVSH